MESRLLKVKAAAQYLGISPWKLRNLTQQGRIPYIPGESYTAPWLYDREDLDEYIRSAKVRF
jgi:excisionase family DNA binding protein